MPQSPKPLREHVAEAVRAMLETNGLEDMADEYEMADSLIASLGLRREWSIRTDRTGSRDGWRSGEFEYRHHAEEHRNRHIREGFLESHIFSDWVRDVQEETGE